MTGISFLCVPPWIIFTNFHTSSVIVLLLAYLAHSIAAPFFVHSPDVSPQSSEINSKVGQAADASDTIKSPRGCWAFHFPLWQVEQSRLELGSPNESWCNDAMVYESMFIVHTVYTVHVFSVINAWHLLSFIPFFKTQYQKNVLEINWSRYTLKKKKSGLLFPCLGSFSLKPKTLDAAFLKSVGLFHISILARAH